MVESDVDAVIDDVKLSPLSWRGPFFPIMSSILADLNSSSTNRTRDLASMRSSIMRQPILMQSERFVLPLQRRQSMAGSLCSGRAGSDKQDGTLPHYHSYSFPSFAGSQPTPRRISLYQSWMASPR
mmetsp:Transcript_8387/g.19241  ORF Transcript_8387/g.19241 Transcript_8387/m.19241 type:complete len:126 (-) Transcript_8387:113-490(-)